MKKKRKIIIIAASVFAVLILLVVGAVVLTLLGKNTPLNGVITTVQSSQCKELAEKLLKAKNETQPFYRCEQEKHKVTDANKSLTRVYAVAGAVERQWEFECGYMEPCATYVGWFDDNGSLFEFAEPPEVANHDPAVYTLGCGQPNSSSIYDVEVKSKIVFEQGKYWWKTDYNNSPTSTQDNPCTVNGTSLVRYDEVLSSVKAQYHFGTDNCSTNEPTPCQTAKALKTKSVEACKYNQQELTGTRAIYDYDCTSNYISQTGDKSLCGVGTAYAGMSCENVLFIKPL